ncbi:unnamed protein product [Rotaria magnacalcarata]|uniref:Uncharacterized protein n=2 Tax=Rotaria magnacalcarata TaxID=392030 RepID=A0A819EUM1_9BILA|nr:unnamed protein product [Rotaria magnacalcarata]CAF2070185.1 unnamed protein product [Rotaria magnacalcarata]CAF2128112.1 unnamed protein product [Rotaria magnacalcarata]CAF3826813.1 unnamed protein product [Rotaria magnacalcarata]CAF3857591.1 unnamed protein product [Rotaria magnacalcarata]
MIAVLFLEVMARLIRRPSMENLVLYDLDKFKLVPSINYKLNSHRRASMNPKFERYEFLCNVERSKIDPIYAATPMFTTIPQSSNDETHQQLIDSSICLENIKSLSHRTSKVEEEKENEEDKEETNDQPKHNEIILNNDCKDIIEKIFNRN